MDCGSFGSKTVLVLSQNLLFVEVNCELAVEDFFCQLGGEGQNGDGSIVVDFGLVPFLGQWSHCCCLPTSGVFCSFDYTINDMLKMEWKCQECIFHDPYSDVC